MGEDYINEALELLKLFEGFRERTYLDGNGIPTIGYGFTDPELVKKGRISRAEADRRLLLEARKREVEVRKRIKNWDNLSNGSKSALLSYYYNYPAGFKDTTRFMGYWNKGDYNAAINEVNAGMNDNNNRGLRDRRLKEQEMLRSDPFLFPQKKKTYWDTVSPQEIPMWMPPTSAQQYSQRQVNDKLRVWDLFENNAVAYGHKKESALPPINKIIDKGKEDFVASVTNAPSLYGDYSPQYPQLIIPKLAKGKDMPKFKRGKTSIPFKPDDSYDIERAIELGYTPDNTGRMPSRDYETGRILKAPWYETVPKTIIDDLRLGYNMKYNKNDGELYSNTWEGNERWNPELKEKLRIPYKKTKQYPHFDPGKDSELVERGGVVYNVDPSAIGASELDVTTPNVNVRSNIGARDAYNKKVALFVSRYPYGAGVPPVEPGLELTFPEFDLLTLVSGVGNLGSKAVKETEDILGSPFVYKDVGYDIAKSPYFKDIYGKYFSREELAKRALRSKAPQIDGFEGLPSYIKGNKFYGVDHDELPEDMYNLVKQSSYNRLRSKRPWMSDLEFDRQFENALKGGYSEYPDETFITAGYPENAGLLFPSNNHIAIRNGYVEQALPHEVRHRMQQVFPHTQEEEDLIAPVFGEWWNGLPEKYPKLSKITSDINAEIDTSIGDFRRKLIGDNNILRMTKEQLNLFMANTSIEQRRKAAHEANGYMRTAYGDKLATSQEEADKWVNQLVNLAQELGAYTTPVIGSAALYNSMKDSGILPNHKNGKDLPKYGGGIGMMGIAAMPGYMIEKNPTVAEIASYLPLIGTVMDVKEAVKNPTAENIGYAALSGITDLVGGKLISKIAKKAIGKKKLFKEAYKSAKTEYELWPYYKNMDPKKAKYKIDYMAKRKAQKSVEDAFGISDFMEDDLNNLILYGNLGAVYGPDFMANMYLQANKK